MEADLQVGPANPKLRSLGFGVVGLGIGSSSDSFGVLVSVGRLGGGDDLRLQRLRDFLVV